MKKVRISVEHRAVRRPYEPGYPASLEPAEYRALVAPRAAGRVRGVVAALGAAAAAGIASAQDPGATREQKVLDLLRANVLERQGYWFSASTFGTKADPGGGKHRVFVPQIPISFGNSYSGVFDAGEARLQARKLFEAYGLTLVADSVVTSGDGKASLDGLDRQRKIGFKIRGGPLARGGFVGAMEAQKEPSETGLSDEELVALAKEGFRIHTAELNDYPVMDQDSSPSRLAYLASVVDFLNGVTDGPDVDLTTIVLGWQQRLVTAEADVTLPKGVSRDVKEGRPWISLKEDGKVVLAVTHRPVSGSPAVREGGRRSKWRIVDKPVSTAGTPTLLDLELSPELGLDPTRKVALTMRVVQELGQGRPPLVVEARTLSAFMPSAFDAAKPFRIELDLPVGRYWLEPGIIVKVMPK